MIKNITITITLLVILILSQVARCETNSISEGIKRAKEENKAILVYFFSKHCEYCVEMERDVLNNKEISNVLKKDIIYLGVDVEESTSTAMQYGVRGYPTTVLIDDKGKMIARIPGYIPKNDFKKILVFLTGKYYKKTDLTSYIKSNRNR